MINIVFFNQITDIFSTVAFFLFGGFLIRLTVNFFKGTKARVLGLYIWHSLFSFAYAYMSLTMPGDARSYYLASHMVLNDFSFGTEAVKHLTAILTNTIGLSFLGAFTVFNFFGSIGLIAVDASLRHVTENKSRFVKNLVLLIVLLPSMNFWTGAIGKDSIAYMSTGLLLWASIDLKRHNVLLLFAFVCMLIIRPHIAAVMIIAFALSLLINKTLSPFKRIFFIITSLIGMTVIIPMTLEYIGYREVFSIDLVQDFVNTRQGYNIEGFGGGIDISSMPFILKLFTYIFRPLPYETHSLLSFLSSLDNLILLMVFTLSLFSAAILKGKTFSLGDSKENRWFLLIFALGVLVISSSMTSNLGISVRQKWMFMPILLYFIFLFIKVKWSDKSKITKV